VKRFVFVSSAEVYGRPHTSPVTEEHPLEPRSPYGAAKAAAEFAARAYSASFGLACVVLRPFSIYGPGVAPASLVGTIVRQVRAGEPVVQLADLRPVRDYCFVGDLADAIARACTANVHGYAAINIGSGEGTSVAALAARAIRAAGSRAEVVENVDARRQESAEIFDLVADVGKARTILGWAVTTSLDDGLAATIQADVPEPA
jgi:nucleoside-diphosphate-sugar epimerase